METIISTFITRGYIMLLNKKTGLNKNRNVLHAFLNQLTAIDNARINLLKRYSTTARLNK